MEENSIPNSYFVNGVDICKEFALAFGKGCGGRIFSDVSILRKGDVALFGNPAAWYFLQQAISEGRNWYYGDKAYFGRGQYYRITKNAYQSDCATIGSMDRLKKLGIAIRPRQYGRKILICRQSAAFYALHNINRDDWVRNTIQTIRQYTDRPIEIRDKVVGNMTEMLFARALQDVHAVVVYTSVAGLQAAINGVPCIATEQCASSSFGESRLSEIENLKLPDNREELSASLANSQWTINEIRNGLAWRMLNENME